MAIVKTIKDGETTMYIHDDYCKDTTTEEVERIMKRIAQLTLPHVRAAMMKEDKTG